TGLTALGDIALGEPVTWTVTSSAAGNGTISPLGAISVKDHHSITFTVTPNTGYNIANLVVDGVTTAAASSYTFTNVVANHTIQANFSIKSFSVTLVTSGNGTLTIDKTG